MSRKIQLGVAFGGVSSEHEVSLASAKNVLRAADRSRFDVTPIGILKDGRWVVGEGALEFLICHAERSRLPTGLFEYLKEQAEAQGADVSGDSTAKFAALLAPRLSISDSRLPTFGAAENASNFNLCKLDCVFSVLHGRMGEDGAMQGLLAIAGVAGVGCGTLASALCMDKIATNMVLDAAGIPRAPWFALEWSGALPEAKQVEEQVQKIGGYPVFVKPANTGSSVGVSKVKLASELSAALTLAARFDRRIVVEKGIKGRELEIGVLGGSSLVASPAVAEVLPKREFYDYEAKYLEDSTKIELPAHIPAELVVRIQELALRAFRAVDANGMARIDFFYDEAADKIYLNELNTIPGFTAISQYPALMKTAGFSYPELISKLVDIALERQRQTEALVI